jgi:hypothetical protein
VKPRNKIVLGVVVAGLILFGWFIFSGSSDDGAFRMYVLNPIPNSVRDMRSAETGLGQDWSISFHFHASAEDASNILASVGLLGATTDQLGYRSSLSKWDSVYIGMGCPPPSLQSNAVFYSRLNPKGFDFALVSQSVSNQEVFLTRWEGY